MCRSKETNLEVEKPRKPLPKPLQLGPNGHKDLGSWCYDYQSPLIVFNNNKNNNNNNNNSVYTFKCFRYTLHRDFTVSDSKHYQRQITYLLAYLLTHYMVQDIIW